MSNNTQRFVGEVAIVTGAGGGIGGAIVKRLSSEGAHSVVVDVNEENAAKVVAEIKAAGGSAEYKIVDISNSEACHKLAADVIAEHGRIDILCNNAGINRRGNILAITDEDWLVTMNVNVNAVFYLSKAVIPYMQEAGGGAIVNTASQWGLYPAQNHIAYNVSKAAVAAFTQNLSRDYAQYKIRVNAVCPGEIHTDMLKAGMARSGKTKADLDALVPFGRIGEPEEVAALVAFLASHEAEFMNGSLVEITGAQPVP